MGEGEEFGKAVRRFGRWIGGWEGVEGGLEGGEGVWKVRKVLGSWGGGWEGLEGFGLRSHCWRKGAEGVSEGRGESEVAPALTIADIYALFI